MIDYRALTDMICEISGAKFSVLNIYDEGLLTYTSVAVSGVNDLVLKLPAILGFNLVGRKWKGDPEIWKKTNSSGLTVFDSIHNIAGDVIPAPLAAIVETVMGLHSVAIASISRKDTPIGNFALLFGKGATMKNIELTQLFTSQVGLLIERSRSDSALRESEKRNRTMIANLPGFVYRCRNDNDWTMSYLSDGCKAITGRDPDYFTRGQGLAYGQMIKADYRDRVWASVQKALKTRTSFEQEYPICSAGSSTERWVWERGQGVFSDSGELLYIEGFITDITDRKKAEEEVKDLGERIHQAQKIEALGVLIAGIAHNMNNMLAAIMAAAAAREAASGEDGNAFRHISTICKRGRELVKSLTNFARPTLAAMKPIELNSLTEEVALIIGNASMRRVELVKSLTCEELWVSGAAGNLNSVLMNLCLNSMDAMPEGGVLEISTSAATPDWAEIRVRDTGTGMTPEILERIFDPFYTTKDVDKGSGLGLSVSYGIIKAHGGTMDFDSTPGKGTVVRVRLPRISKPAPCMASAVPEVENFPALNILLVDDDEDVRFLTSRMLEKAGNTVNVVESGEECLALLETELSEGRKPDLVILDQNMPRMSGIQVLQRIRQLDILLPVMISSGQPDIRDWECFKKPNVAVLPKPFDMKELRVAVKSLIRSDL